MHYSILECNYPRRSVNHAFSNAAHGTIDAIVGLHVPLPAGTAGPTAPVIHTIHFRNHVSTRHPCLSHHNVNRNFGQTILLYRVALIVSS